MKGPTPSHGLRDTARPGSRQGQPLRKHSRKAPGNQDRENRRRHPTAERSRAFLLTSNPVRTFAANDPELATWPFPDGWEREQGAYSMKEYDLYLNAKKPRIGLYVRKGASLTDFADPKDWVFN